MKLLKWIREKKEKQYDAASANWKKLPASRQKSRDNQTKQIKLPKRFFKNYGRARLNFSGDFFLSTYLVQQKEAEQSGRI